MWQRCDAGCLLCLVLRVSCASCGQRTISPHRSASSRGPRSHRQRKWKLGFLRRLERARCLTRACERPASQATYNQPERENSGTRCDWKRSQLNDRRRMSRRRRPRRQRRQRRRQQRQLMNTKNAEHADTPPNTCIIVRTRGHSRGHKRSRDAPGPLRRVSPQKVGIYILIFPVILSAINLARAQNSRAYHRCRPISTMIKQYTCAYA